MDVDKILISEFEDWKISGSSSGRDNDSMLFNIFVFFLKEKYPTIVSIFRFLGPSSLNVKVFASGSRCAEAVCPVGKGM